MTVSVKNYNNDKKHYKNNLNVEEEPDDKAIRTKRNRKKDRGWLVDRGESSINSSQYQTQSIVIDVPMQSKHFRSANNSRRNSITSAEDNSYDFGSDQFGSIDSSDNESGRYPDAQRTYAYQQATNLQHASGTTDKNKGKFGSPGMQRRVTGLPSVSSISCKLRTIWRKHKVRVILACLLLYYVGFTSYDVYSTR